MAAMEWSRVQVLRPRASTSGGQSFGGGWVLRVALAWVVKEAKELQERQLGGVWSVEVGLKVGEGAGR